LNVGDEHAPITVGAAAIIVAVAAGTIKLPRVAELHRRPAAAGAVVLLALAERVAGKIRQAKPPPAAPIDP
jgi:hypothetical protein